MAYKVEFSSAAAKAIEDLPNTISQRLVKKAQALGQNPFPRGSKKLQGEEEQWRIRVGDYRIVYQVDGDQAVVLVVRAGHRRDIYR